MKRAGKFTLGVALTLALATGGGSAYATEQINAAPSSGAKTTDPQPTPVKTTTAYVKFDHPVTLPDAVAASASFAGPVLGFRYENTDIVGEYSLLSDQTIDAFLAEFATNFSSQPEVTALITEIAVPESSEANARKVDVPPIVTEAEEFNAPPITLSTELAPMAEPPAVDEAAQRLAGDWRPTQADFRLVNSNGPNIPSGPNIYESYFWINGDSPSLMPESWGAEFEINLYNNAVDLRRPACPGNYKDNFWAKNYGWNWNIFRPDNVNADIAAMQAYADVNDLGDSCNKNSIAIGIKRPQLIQFVNGAYGIQISVRPPAGTATSSVVGGNVQAVFADYCNSFPGSSMALTDCMGVTAGTWPGPGEPFRITANKDNGWTAPNKCWSTFQKGLVPAVSTAC